MTKNNQQFNQTIIIITGPTAAGKTDFALELASHIPSEIINMDMGQMYTPFSIGTAKPDWRSFSVPHHMFDIISDPVNYTVVEYRKALLKHAHNTWAKNKFPIVVGGSMFYLKSLFFPPDQHVACDTQPEILQQNFQDKTTEALWDQLFVIDPLRAQKINRADRYRIERALLLYQITGKKPSECVLSYTPPSSYILLYVTRDRAELYQRIDQRVNDMVDQGWLDEVKGFIETPWQLFIQNKKIIGYNELIQFLTSAENSRGEYEKVIALIQQKSRHYAKRQDTFWRSLKKELESCIQYHADNAMPFIQEVNITHAKQSEYIKDIVSKLLCDKG